MGLKAQLCLLPSLPLPRRRGSSGDQEVATCAHWHLCGLSCDCLVLLAAGRGGEEAWATGLSPARTRQEYPDTDWGKGREARVLARGQDTALLESACGYACGGKCRYWFPGPTPSGNSQPHIQTQRIHVHGEKASGPCEHIGTQKCSKGLPPHPVGLRTKIHPCWQPGSHHVCAAVMPQTFHSI